MGLPSFIFFELNILFLQIIKNEVKKMIRLIKSPGITFIFIVIMLITGMLFWYLFQSNTRDNPPLRAKLVNNKYISLFL